MITETVYRNRDNVNSLELRANGTAQDISSTTRMTLQVGDKLIDSDLTVNVFDWSTNGAGGQLDLTLGHQGLETGTYTATLTIFDLTYPNGLCWGDFVVKVR
jgi:hypothetical protein